MTDITRKATTTATVKQVENYLPSNYSAYEKNGKTIIEGKDWRGYTLDGYIIPRLASGLISAKEI